MAAKTKSKSAQPSLTRQYKATVQLEAEAASLNWVAALGTAHQLTYCLEKIVIPINIRLLLEFDHNLPVKRASKQ